MPTALVIPLQLNADGTFMVTDDPAIILKQRILDLLVTSKWERVHRVNHGCDLESFLFTNVIDHILASKSSEIAATLRNSISYGDIVQVLMTPLRQQNGIESSVMVEVLFRVFEGGNVQQLSETFTTVQEGELS